MLGVIFAIFGGDKPGHTPSQRWAYYKEAYRDPVGMQVNLTNASRAHPRNSLVLITFIEDEGKRLHHPHWDALVINLEIKKHKVMRNLIDNGNTADIIFFRIKPCNPLKITFGASWATKLFPLGRLLFELHLGNTLVV